MSFGLEPLESRILLSAEGGLGELAASEIVPSESELHRSQIVEELPLSESVEAESSSESAELFQGLESVEGPTLLTTQEGILEDPPPIAGLQVLVGDTVTSGDDIFLDDNVILSQGKTINLSTGPGGGDIFITGTLNGTADGGGEHLILNAGQGNIIIVGQVGNHASLASVTILSAGQVEFRAGLDGVDSFSQWGGLGNTQFKGDVVVGDLFVKTFNSVVFEGGLESTAGSIELEIDPASASGLVLVKGDATSAGHLIVQKAKDVTFEQNLTAAGEYLQPLGTGTTRFDGTVQVDGLELAAEVRIRFGDLFSVTGGGDVALKSDEIDFEGGAGSVSGTGRLTLVPFNASTTIDIGSPVGGTGALSLSDADLSALADGFERILLGDELSGSGAIELGSTTLNDPAEIVGGGIVLTDQFEGSESLLLKARTGSIQRTEGILSVERLFLEAQTGISLTTDVDEVSALNLGMGPISLTESNSITIKSLEVANGSADLVAGGWIRADAVRLSTDNDANDLTLQATQGDLQVGRIATGGASSDVTLTADQGRIVDVALEAANAGEERPNLVADSVTLRALSGVGMGSDDLNLVANRVDVINSGPVGPILLRQHASGGDLDLAELTQSHDGNQELVAVVAENGSLRLLSNGATVHGHVLLRASGSGSDLTLDGPVQSSQGSLSLIAVGDVNQAADLISLAGGTIEVESLLGSILMNDGIKTQTEAGNIRYRAQNHIVLGRLDARTGTDRTAGSTANQKAWGEVSLRSGTGSITDAAPMGDTAADIYGRNTRFSAQGGSVGELGAGHNAIETEVIGITAVAGLGGISLTDETDLEVGTVFRVEADRIRSDGTLDLVQDAFGQTGHSAEGSVVQQTADGHLLVQGSVDSALGNILLNAVGVGSRIQVRGNLVGTTGHISVKASGNIDQRALVEASGTIDLEATGGQILMEEGAHAKTNGSAIRLLAGTDIELGRLDARTDDGRTGGRTTDQSNWGEVSVRAVAGSIRDATQRGEASVDLWSKGARLTAGGSIGQFGSSGNEITLEAAVASAIAAAGGIHLSDETAVEIGSVGEVTAQRVQPNGTTQDEQDSVPQSGHTTLATGPLVHRSLGGSLIVTNPVDAVGGGVLLEAGGSGENLTLNAQVGSDGPITLVAPGDIVVQSLVVSSGAGGAGTVDVEAETGSITMADGARLQTNGSNIRFTAELDLVLGELDARTESDRTGSSTAQQAQWGDVSLEAELGAILDVAAAGDSAVDLFARGLRLFSSSRIGLLGSGVENALESEAQFLAGATGAGGFYIVESSDLQIDTVGRVPVDRVASDATTSVVSSAEPQGDLIVASGGILVLQSLGGSLRIEDGTAGLPGVGISAGDRILVEAQGSASDLVVNTAVLSPSSVSLSAGRDLWQNALIQSNGSLDIGALSGSIQMAATSRSETAGSNIRYEAGAGIELGVLDARSASDRANGMLSDQANWGDVTLVSGGGVMDANSAGDTDVDVYAQGLRISADTGVGELGVGVNALETEVVITTSQSGSLGIHQIDSTSVSVGTVGSVSVDRVQSDGTVVPVSHGVSQSGHTTSAGGSIVQRTVEGALTVAEAVSAGGSNILLEAQGANQSLGVNAAVSSGSGNITVWATGPIDQQANITTGTSGSGGSLDVESLGGAVSMGAGVVSETNGGNIRYQAATSVFVGQLDARTTADRLGASLTGQALWGDVLVTAYNGSVTDSSSADTGVDAYGRGVRFLAEVGVGTLGVGTAEPLETEASQVAAAAAAGGINLIDESDVSVGTVDEVFVNRVLFDGSVDSEVGDDITELSGLSATGTGALVFRTKDGTLQTESTVSTESGALLLEAQSTGSAAMLALNGLTSTESGAVTLKGASGLTQQGNVLTKSGTLDIEAVSGDVVMSEGALIQSDGADARVGAGGEVVLSEIDLRRASDRSADSLADQANWGSLAVLGGSGSVRDASAATDTAVDAYASSLLLSSTSGGVGEVGGVDNPLETEVLVLSARAGASGIHQVDKSALTIGSAGGFSVERGSSGWKHGKRGHRGRKRG